MKVFAHLSNQSGNKKPIAGLKDSALNGGRSPAQTTDICATTCAN